MCKVIDQTDTDLLVCSESDTLYDVTSRMYNTADDVTSRMYNTLHNVHGITIALH